MLAMLLLKWVLAVCFLLYALTFYSESDQYARINFRLSFWTIVVGMEPCKIRVKANRTGFASIVGGREG